jgi:cell division protein FtsL
MKKQKQTGEAEVPNYASFKNHKKNKYIYFFAGFFMLLLLVICSITQISVSNSIATEGLTLGKIQQQIDETKKANMLLAEQVYETSSYTHIASQAATIGFVEAKTPIFITDPGPLAIRP